MAFIVVVTQYALCFLSMLLTGLFCVQVSHSSSAVGAAKLASVVAMLVIGIGFDLSKYIFWHFRCKSKGYLINCLALVIFSWSASVAFFISHEQTRMESARKALKSYQAHEIDIKSIKAQILHKTTILESRTSSQFHEQWDKAEILSDNIRQLEQLLKQKISELDQIGTDTTTESNKFITTSLFRYLSPLFGVPAKDIAITVYAILALLIESCSLGVISLSSTIKQESLSTSKNRQLSTHKKPSTEADKTNTISGKMQILKNDIAAGKIDPVLRRIRKSHYHLSENNIRKVLTEMKEQGLLVDGPRSLMLATDER